MQPAVSPMALSHRFPFSFVETALHIYLSVMVLNCAEERSFSKLRRIKLNEKQNKRRTIQHVVAHK
jgi:hypothetical protein